MNIIFNYLLAWIGLAVIMILNGIMRGLYQPFMSELMAHQISTITGIVLVFLVTWFMNKNWPIPSDTKSLYIGVSWLIMTILFEFIFGHYVIGHPWNKLFHDYNLLEGRIWSLFLAAITIMPYTVFVMSK